MRPIEEIVIHCSATREGVFYNAAMIDADHKKRGFIKIGYHFVILQDGTIERGRKIEEIGAHVTGHNKNTVGICYVGGLDKQGNAKDTRTEKQKESLLWVIKNLKSIYPSIKKVKGHRDYSPDLNGDGKISKFERIKECPCFDAEVEYQYLLIKN